jgi:hypothetical protein
LLFRLLGVSNLDRILAIAEQLPAPFGIVAGLAKADRAVEPKPIWRSRPPTA